MNRFNSYQRNLFVLYILFCFVLSACKKVTEDKIANLSNQPKNNQVYKNDFNNPFFVQNKANPDFVADSTKAMKRSPNMMRSTGMFNPELEYTDERQIILGSQLNNPYSIANMTHAYELYYGTSFQPVPTTDLYVKFEPQTEADLAFLEDSLDLDLYDHPLDHELIQDGDYYIHPGRSIEDMPIVYTVVEPEFDFGQIHFPYTILGQLPIPNPAAL